MGIFKRLRDLTMASINDLLDKAEDPVKMLNQFLRDMEQDIQEAEVAVAKQIAIEKKFKQQYEEAQEMVEKRSEQAMKALEQGNEDLARRALQDKKEHQERFDEMKRQYDMAKTNADRLRNQLAEMKEEFGKKITPFGRGIVGFLVSALVIWGAQFIVGGVHASIIGALLAALVIGIIDLFIPVATPFKHSLNGDERKD